MHKNVLQCSESINWDTWHMFDLLWLSHCKKILPPGNACETALGGGWWWTVVQRQRRVVCVLHTDLPGRVVLNGLARLSGACQSLLLRTECPITVTAAPADRGLHTCCWRTWRRHSHMHTLVAQQACWRARTQLGRAYTWWNTWVCW